MKHTGTMGLRPPMSSPHTPKRHRAGTHRAVTPEETLERVRRLMPVLAITRIANVTGLDTIGIPVAMVFRPNARSLSVSQGKGLTLAAAKASGLMEALELAHAESVELPLRHATLNELRFSVPLVDVAALPRLSVSTFHGDMRTLWVAGQELLGGGPAWVPYEMVHMDYSLPLPQGSRSFLMSSNGLASGNHPLEAVSHAVCELVERDATTLFRLSSPAEQARARVDLSTVEDSACREVLEKYERAGVEVAAWEITSDVGIPAFSCTIVDREPDPSRPIGPMGGIGCHPSRAIALLRALTEAAQSRLTVISGARDDVTHSPEGPEGDLAAARRRLAALAAEQPTRSFHQAPDHDAESFDEDVAWELERLRAAGFKQVVAVDLTRPVFGVPVVRVIIPGLEPLNDIPGYVPGERARRRVQEAAP